MLRTIGDSAFQSCSSLSSLKLPEGLQTIGHYSFSDDSLSSVSIPSTVQSIGIYGFGNNPLTSFSIPKESQLTNISEFMLHSTNIDSLFIPKYCSIFVGTALYWNTKIISITIDPDNQNFVVESGCVYSYDRKTLLYRFSSLTTAFSVPNSVEILGAGCFCSSQCTSITVPDSVTTISEYCFYTCVASSIELPDSILTVGIRSFKNTNKLFYVRLPNKLKSIPGEFMRGCAIYNITIPDNVTYIGSSAFSACKNLVEINLPEKLQYIGGAVISDSPKAVFVFANNSNIYISANMLLMDKDNTYIAQFFDSDASTVSIPETVTRIKLGSFQRKTNLISVTCPSTSQLQYIEARAFSGCTKLITIFALPEIKYIDNYAFYQCSLSNGIEFGPNLYFIGKYCFSEVSDLKTIEFMSTVNFTLSENAFSMCSKVNKLIFNNELNVSIGEYCFSGLSSLTELVIPLTVASAGSFCFSSSGLEKVTFESNLFTPGYLPAGIFSNCSRLSDFSIPENINSLGKQCLEMTLIKTVSIPDNVIDLGSQSFRQCNLLKVVSITNTSKLTNIGLGVFEGCSNFSRFVPFKSQNFVVDYGALYTSSLDKMIVYPPASPTNFFALAYSVKSIAESAFNGCINLEIVLIPDSTVHSIGASAFYGCIKLRSINIPLCVETIGRDAFSHCPLLSCGIVVQNKTSSFRQQLLLAGLPLRSLRECNINTCAFRVQPNNLISLIGVIIIM